MSSRKRTQNADNHSSLTKTSSNTPDKGLTASRLGAVPDPVVSMGAEDEPNLTGDYGSVSLLLLLYVLQGVPLGLAGSVPLVLQSRGVSYSLQAVFSLVYWPFSLKLLWAPVVDSLFVARAGRRKTWLVPTQYLISFFMLLLSAHVPAILGDGAASPEETGESEGSAPPVDVYFLTAIFFALNFLAATQDIAVDGWALTMLARRNVGYASTCNSVGQTAGYFLGNVVFLALESADFCNAYLRSEPQPHGLVTLSGFLYFWACVFFVTTTCVAIFKRERAGQDEEHEDNCGVFGTYRQLYKLIKLPALRTYITFALTYKIGFAAADAVTGLKLIEEGVPREKMAMLAVPMVPLQVILPWVISRYTSGPRPLDLLLTAMPFRLLIGGVLFSYIVWWTPSVKSDSGEFPTYYFAILVTVYALYQLPLYSMFVASMAFNARISDPRIGGTYMTLLNTVQNLGGNWPATVALWLVDSLTWKSCLAATAAEVELDCDTKSQAKACSDAGGHCQTDVDGYYLEIAACLVMGFSWLLWRSRRVRQLQDIPEEEWKCPK